MAAADRFNTARLCTMPHWSTTMRLPAMLALGLITAQGHAMADTGTQPIVRIAELEIDPQQLAAYTAKLAEEIAESIRSEPGVVSLNAVSLRDNPAQIRIFEVYADRAAYEAHLKSPHFSKYKVETADMVLSLRLLETEPVALGTRPPRRRR